MPNDFNVKQPTKNEKLVQDLYSYCQSLERAIIGLQAEIDALLYHLKLSQEDLQKAAAKMRAAKEKAAKPSKKTDKTVKEKLVEAA